MSIPEFHEATFKWPHLEARDVIVTGEFDGWSQSIHLPRTQNGFEGLVKVPWGRKVAFKYIVDGRWTTTDTQPTELDPMGNINNVYTAPSRPSHPKKESPLATPKAASLTPTEIKPETVESTNDIIATVDAVKASPQANGVKQTEAAPGSPDPSLSTVVSHIGVESILPSSAQNGPVGSIVPVPVLPLITDPPSPTTVNEEPKSLDTSVVEAATTASDVPPPAEPVEGISTHTPGTVNGNGNTHSPSQEAAASVPLPPPTPAEIPLPPTPATNGKTEKSPEVSSTTSSPTSSPHKRMPFPTFGRHSRKSSSSADVSEHGEVSGSPKGTISNRMGAKKKRTSSIFGKLKDIFSHEHHDKEKAAEAK